MGQYRMKIDLQKCVGCGACAMACKTGNNTEARSMGQTHNWADFIYETKNAFPATTWQATPVLCNHCENPACVAACPVSPDSLGRKAVYKSADGIVMNNNKRCVGCRRCQRACPYSVLSTNRTSPAAGFSVISYNAKTAHSAWTNDTSVIPGCTGSPKQLVENDNVEMAPPNRTAWVYDDSGAELRDIRAARTVEKCNLCVHRLGDADLPEAERKPYCVLACPAQARSVEEAADPAVFPVGAKVLEPESRTEAKLIDPAEVVGRLKPQTYYVNDFCAR